MVFVTQVMEHCLEPEIAQWVQYNDPSHHEQMLYNGAIFLSKQTKYKHPKYLFLLLFNASI